MLNPDPSKHNPDPDYIRGLIGKIRIDGQPVSIRKAAKLVCIPERTLRGYVSQVDPGECPYPVQFCLEVLAATEYEQK